MGWSIVQDRSKDMAVHAVLVPGGARGRILYYGGYSVDDTHLFDVEARTVSDISAAESPGYNIFCSGHAWLGDGRVLSAGGQLTLFTPNGQPIDPPPAEAGAHPHGGMGWGGERRAAIFSPVAGEWQPAEPMHLDPAGNPESGGRWYPTLVTLADGEVLAVGGHPDRREEYPASEPHRHSNSTPERYSPATGTWALLAGDPPAENQLTAEDGVAAYDYQRTHLLPSGLVFFASPVRGANRRYDPYAGFFVDPPIDLPDDPMYQDVWAAWTSVMLPLLHQEGFRPRVLVAGGESAETIDLGAASPQWQPTTPRDWPSPAPRRHYGCPVLLPTGEVFYTGGTAVDGDDATKQANTIHRAETFDPQVDYEAGTFGAGQWHTQTQAEGATVGRHYHGTALLMPDGTVWTAGSNGPSEEGGDNELRIEVFDPEYGPGRPQITSSPPSTGHGVPFRVHVAAGTDIRRVVLLRSGSVTHSYNPDQRYLSVDFDKVSATELLVFTPVDSAVAPPGWYMVWVLDASGRPCEWAPFIRLTKQKCTVTADISTYSIHEVDALAPPKQLDDALFVVFDAFLPGEVTTPSVTIDDGNGQTVAGMEPILGAPKYEGGAQNVDRQQRVVYPVSIRFTDPDAAFALIPAGEDFSDVFLRVRMRDFAGDARLTLSRNANPRMSDGNPHYLSMDLRVFKTGPAEEPLTAGLQHPPAGAGAPFAYIGSVLSSYNGWSGAPGEKHPFELLPTDLETNQLALYSQDANHNAVYDYAVAQVRYRAPVGIDANDVRVFFRLWTTGWTALTYSDPHAGSGSYRRHGDGPAAAPLLGITGGEINNVPCFAQARVADMTGQADDRNLLPVLAGAGEQEVHAYFGCWIDVNDGVKRFPLAPGSATGPFGGELLSIQQLMRGLHQCLVAEIHYTPDPTPPGADPGSSDNLAQRNLLFDESDNPGGFAAHVVHHTFELKPSPNGLGPPTRDATGFAAAKQERVHPDELCIDWGNLPRDSHVTLYMPQVDVDEVVRWSSQRPGPGNLETAGPGTLRLRVTDVGFVPIPGPLAQNIASLLSVQLPPGVNAGQRFHVVLRQVDGKRRKVVGASRFEIAVTHGGELLPRLERRLAVLLHVFEAIPQGNRWHPVFERYLGELRDRVRALGGDPDAVEASPTGNPGGGRGGPGDGPGPGDGDGHPGDALSRCCMLLCRMLRRCMAM
jgi:hypothetical protein